VASFFFPTPFAWGPLALLSIIWVVQGVRLARKEERIQTPTTMEDFQRLVVARIHETVGSHRQRVLASDSGYATRHAEREQKLEKAKGLVAEIETMVKAGELEEEYAKPRLSHVLEGMRQIEEDIERITGGKQELLDKLRRLESHPPRFEKVFIRRSLDARIVSFASEAGAFKDDTEAFLIGEINAFRRDAAVLMKALEQMSLHAVGSVSIEEVEQSGEFIASLSA